MNTITIELCAEDRARLDAIIVGLQWLANAGQASAPVEEHPIDAPVTHFEAPAEPPAPAAKPIPLPEFQSAMTRRAAESADMRNKVRDLIHRYAPSVSEIPEDKRPEVLAELVKL